MLSYFNETDSKPCGKCDVCQQKKEKELSNEEFQKIKDAIEILLSKNESTARNLLNELPYKENKILQVLRYLMDNKQIRQNERMKITWIKE